MRAHIKSMILCLIFFASCGRYDTTTPPVTYRATQGLSIFDGEAYRWINNAKGSTNLENAQISGGVFCDKKLGADCSDIKHLCIGGEAWLHNTIIRGYSYIENGARVIECQVRGPFNVTGNLTACESIFYDTVHVDGMITAKDSCFKNHICARSEIVTLDATQTQSIYIEPTGPYYDPQVICIRNGSVVEGNIHFTSGRGKIVLDGTSSIYGTICGGHIIKPFDCYEQCE